MEDLTVIYRILKILHKAMDLEEFDNSVLSAEALGISNPKWNRIMAMIVSEGYISGIDVRTTFDCRYPKATLVRPELTLKGLEYLEENSTMKKIADTAKGILGIASNAL